MFEITSAIAMKLSQGFSKPLESSMTVTAMVLSFVFLVLAVRDLHSYRNSGFKNYHTHLNPRWRQLLQAV